MKSLAIVSLHTSPLAQPGSGDGGGMNVYVRELATALAHAGVQCDVYTRRTSPDQPDCVDVEPGFRVRHIDAGAHDLDKADLPAVVAPFTERLIQSLEQNPVDAIHANYWLSADAGHRAKHELNLPLAVTFHTLGSVKAALGDHEPVWRIEAEHQIIGCSDVVFASCDVEAEQLVEFYDTPAERIGIVPPGVDHALFSPGQKWAARQAAGLDSSPMILFVGRIQPLKGLDIAIQSLAASSTGATLVVVGGPSGEEGEAHLTDIEKMAVELGVADRIQWFPPQPHHLLSTFYRAADLCIAPSRSESFGLVALEASACGTPVVASAVGGLQTIVDHGRTGLLVPDRDPFMFAEAIDTIVNDELLLIEMGDAAARRAAGYTWRSAATRVRELFTRLDSRSLVDCR